MYHQHHIHTKRALSSRRKQANGSIRAGVCFLLAAGMASLICLYLCLPPAQRWHSQHYIVFSAVCSSTRVCLGLVNPWIGRNVIMKFSLKARISSIIVASWRIVRSKGCAGGLRIYNPESVNAARGWWLNIADVLAVHYHCCHCLSLLRRVQEENLRLKLIKISTAKKIKSLSYVKTN